MNAPRTPAELRELSLQLAVDLARNGRLTAEGDADLASAITAAAEHFTTFLQGPRLPSPDLDPCACGHSRINHQGGLHACGHPACTCTAFVLDPRRPTVGEPWTPSAVRITDDADQPLCDCGHPRKDHHPAMDGCGRCDCRAFTEPDKSDDPREEVPRCPRCGHMPHVAGGCLNMASDDDCACPEGPLPLPPLDGAS